MNITPLDIHPCFRRPFAEYKKNYDQFDRQGLRDFLLQARAGGLFEEVINRELATINANNFYESEYWTYRGFTLIASPLFVLTVDKVPHPPNTTIGTISSDAVILATSSHTTLDCYALPEGMVIDEFDKNLELTLQSRQTLSPEEPVYVDHRHQTVDLYSEIDGDYIIKAISPSWQRFAWSFDRHTLKPRNLASQDMSDDMAMTALEALVHIGNADSARIAESLLSAQSHYVRWKAFQVLNELAPQRARVHLHSFLNDSHPHIRRAAARAA
jgi:hypothetical protein